MFWWILIGIASVFVVRHLWRAYSHPYNMLVRQAANMNWVVAGTMKYPNGIRNIRLRRGDLLVEVSFKEVNVRLLQPDVERPFKDFVDLEQWLGAKKVTTHKLHADPKAADSSMLRKEVDYFDKVSNLLAAKGAREDFTTLQGWDKEFGTASARVCAMAELVNESAVVVAAFILESIEYYHKNRDVALSYLARLESGYRAKIENPALAATIDAEAITKDEAEGLFKSFESDPDSSGAVYIQQVNDFIRSTGYYDSLVLPAQRQADFIRASANVYVAGYQTDSSPKVVGALIADGANKYRLDRQLGVVFLNKAAASMRKRYGEAPSMDNKASSITPPSAKPNSPASSLRTYKSEAQHIENEAAAYHAALDSVAKNSLTFIINNGFLASERHTADDQKLYAELLLYLTTCNARNVARIEIHPGTWNTFKRSVEIRMLGIRDDGHQRSGVIRTPDGGRAYAQFTSTYWQRMDALEEILHRRGAPGLIQHLLGEMGADSGKHEQFITFFNKLSDDASSSLVPRIAAFD